MPLYNGVGFFTNFFKMKYYYFKNIFSFFVNKTHNIYKGILVLVEIYKQTIGKIGK